MFNIIIFYTIRLAFESVYIYIIAVPFTSVHVLAIGLDIYIASLIVFQWWQLEACNKLLTVCCLLQVANESYHTLWMTIWSFCAPSNLNETLRKTEAAP